MSREVELKNIQMTATVPEDIQISLGAIGSSSDTVKLANDKGVLTSGSESGSVSGIAAPATDYDWSNIANVGAYYQFGRLIPASSTNGADIFFTPDAKGDGKTVKTGATYYQADGNNASSYKATSHAYTSTEKGDSVVGGIWSGYQANTGWNTTNDDGYYVDIPIWLRTSSKDPVNLQVTGYVVAGDLTIAKEPVSTITEGDVLKNAVRVAVLTTADAAVTNLIDLKDAASNGTTILNWYGNNGTTIAENESNQAVKSVNTGTATYGTGVVGTNTTANNDTVSVTQATADQNGYGVACPYVVRVWLEGEDPDCWNGTAGQDWQICLKFTNPNGDTAS